MWLIDSRVMVIKLTKKVEFPSELTTEDIISDITNSDPSDAIFQKFKNKTNDQEFEQLCQKVDERTRLNDIYKTVKLQITELKETL